MLVEMDVVLLGGAVIALWTFVRFFSSVGADVNVDLGLVLEQFGALGAASSFWVFGRHFGLMGSIYEMGTEVVFVDQVVAEGMVGSVADGAIITMVDAGYGTELDVV